jgi:NADH-quinone oxidoreductase subunit H
VIGFLTLMLKTLFFCWLFIWVRWTLPRFRYDQLMSLGWKVLVPIGLVNILLTGVLIKMGVW